MRAGTPSACHPALASARTPLAVSNVPAAAAAATRPAAAVVRYHLDEEDQVTCRERSKCLENPSICGYGRGQCLHRPYPEHSCVCNPGFQLVSESGTCEDIDECRDDPSIAQLCKGQFATCLNFVGSFRCDCQFGFYNDTARGKCRASAFAFAMQLDFANAFEESWRDPCVGGVCRGAGGRDGRVSGGV